MKTERNILEEYLGNSVERWKIAYTLMKYKIRSDKLSEAEKNIINNFLREKNNENLYNSIANNFKEIFDNKINSVAVKIVQKIAHCKECEALTKSGGGYIDNHYVNINLNNGIILQLEYKKYPIFNLLNINAGFGSFADKKKIETKVSSLENKNNYRYDRIYYPINKKFTNEKDEIEALLSEDKLIEAHEQEIGNKIRLLISEYENL